MWDEDGCLRGPVGRPYRIGRCAMLVGIASGTGDEMRFRELSLDIEEGGLEEAIEELQGPGERLFILETSDWRGD